MVLTIVNPGVAPPPEPIILGIDLGTTFSLAAFMKEGAIELIRDDRDDARVPSAIAFGKHGEVTIGKGARERAIADPQHTAYSIKRLIGKTMAELESELKYVPYQVIEREATGGRKILHVLVGGREHTPEELSAMILKEVAGRAAAKLGQPVEKAVITVPAYFDESQRQATRDAGRLAGLDVVRIVNEPTAAALAYGLQERKEGLIAVYDFGGGTFDCSVLQLQDGVFKVLSTHGDTHLGGDDIDRELMKVIEDRMPAAGLAAGDPVVRQALRDACERLKIALTLGESAPLVVDIPARGVHYEEAWTRDDFEKLIAPLVDRTIASCRAALRDAELRPTEIDEVVLVGGSSRIPLVRRRVEELFGRRPHTELNPDEVVAMGAAVQGSILAGKLKQLLLLDITPLSLGIQTIGGGVSKLIPRNSTIPAKATELFTTFMDNQSGVDIHVVQGEREMAKDCRSLGRFVLKGIPPMPAGMPRVEVTFLIDANGILNVTARERNSGREAGIEVQPSHGLNREEVERMIRESVAKGREDFVARRLADLRTKAESNIRHTEKGLNSAGQRIPAEAAAAIRSAIEIVRNVEKTEDPDVLQKAIDALDAANAPLVEVMFNAVLDSEVVSKRLQDF